MLLSKLQSCGLTKSEAQIYLALLQKKEFAASEISSLIPVGRTRIYEIIPVLIAKGLCVEIQKNGKKMYYAVEPDIALNNLTLFFQQELEEEFSKKKEALLKKSESFTDIKSELNKIYTDNNQKTDEFNYVEIIKDLKQIKTKWLNLQDNFKKEMLVFTKSPFTVHPSKNIKYEKPILKKKVDVKSIYEYKDITAGTKDNFIKMLEEYERAGEKVKVIKNLPLKLALFDGKTTLLSVNDPVSMKPSLTTILVNHPDFAEPFKRAFETYWAEAYTVEEFKKIKIK